MIKSCCVMGGLSPRNGDKKRKLTEPKDWLRLEDQFFRINVSLVNITSNLDSLSRILEDLEDDPLKASKKQIEFSTRFTRNYLCELRQKMNDIRKHLEQSENENPPRNQPIFQCFTSSFQTVHQAFQNIEKNLSDLCVIANAAYWEGCGDKLLELGHLNSSLILKLNDIEYNTRKAEIQKKEKQRTILKFKNEAKKPQPVMKKNKGINFPMYKSAQANSFEKLWKKKTRALAEARFGNKQEYQIKNYKNKEESVKNEKTRDKSVLSEDKSKMKETAKIETKAKDETIVRSKRKMIKPVPENEMETMVQNIAIASVTSESEMEEEPIKQENSENGDTMETNEAVTVNEIQLQNIEADSFQMGTVLDEAFKTMFNHIMSQVMTNIDPERKESTQDEATANSVALEVKKFNFREDNVKLICIVEDETSKCVEIQN